MENPLTAGTILLERFISVEVFEKIVNTFRGITCFLNFTEIPENFPQTPAQVRMVINILIEIT